MSETYKFHGEYIDAALRPLVAALKMRYPGVRIVEASLRPLRDDAPSVLQQSIRYQAPLELLRHVGLVTEEMLASKAARTALGDGFNLCSGLDEASRPGCYDLSIFTGSVPRERERMSVKDAARVLRRISRVHGGIK